MYFYQVALLPAMPNLIEHVKLNGYKATRVTIALRFTLAEF